MDARRILAGNLKRLRKEQKLSQESLAHRAGLTKNYVGSLEREEYAATVDVLQDLARALDVKLAALLDVESA